MIYVAMAHRWGDRADHSYLIGAWPQDSLGIAEAIAKAECERRGGKYATAVYAVDGTKLTKVYYARSMAEDDSFKGDQ